MESKKVDNKKIEISELEPQKRVVIPDDIKKEVDSQLKPLFEKNFYASSPQFKLFMKSESKYFSKLEKMQRFLSLRIQSTEVLFEGFSACKSNKEDILKLMTFQNAIYYLSLIEVLGNNYVDQTILLLIGCGYAFHLEPYETHRYIRHAKTLEDIESPSVTLSIKLDFLYNNGFTFFKKWIKRNLRNKIAHLDFEIDKKGFILFKEHINQKKMTKINLGEELNTFLCYFTCVSEIFTEEIMKTGKK